MNASNNRFPIRQFIRRGLCLSFFAVALPLGYLEQRTRTLGTQCGAEPVADVVGGDGGEGFAEGGQQRVACACRVCVSRVRVACACRVCVSRVRVACACRVCVSRVRVACACRVCVSRVRVACACRVCVSRVRVACACRVCVSRVRVAIRRRAVLSFENIRSIGFNSGLYGGRNSSRTPAAAHRFRARGAAPS